MKWTSIKAEDGYTKLVLSGNDSMAICGVASNPYSQLFDAFAYGSFSDKFVEETFLTEKAAIEYCENQARLNGKL